MPQQQQIPDGPLVSPQQESIFQSRLFDQFIQNPDNPQDWSPSGLKLFLSWDGDEPTEAEIDQVFTQVFDEGWLTGEDFAPIGGILGGIGGGVLGGIPGAIGGATALGAAGEGLHQTLRPKKVGRISIEGVPRETYLSFPMTPPGGWEEGEALKGLFPALQGTDQGDPYQPPSEGDWYPGRTTTPGDIAAEIAGSGIEEGLLEGAGGMLMRPLQWLGRGIQRIAMGGQDLPNLMAETGQRAIKESLERGIGPKSTYSGSRWLPYNPAMGGRPAGLAAQKIGESLDAVDDIVAQVGPFDTPLLGTDSFLRDVLQSPAVTRGQTVSDKIMLGNDLANQRVLRLAEEAGVDPNQFGPLFSRYLRDPAAPPQQAYSEILDVAGARVPVDRPESLTAAGEISLKQAVDDKRYLDKEVLGPLYSQTLGGGSVNASSTLVVARAIREQLSERIKSTLQYHETLDPRLRGLTDAYNAQNQETQMLNYMSRLVQQSDPRIIPQMALGFGAGAGGATATGAAVAPALGTGALAATMLSPPVWSRGARTLYGLGRLPAPQTALRLGDIVGTRGSEPLPELDQAAGPTIQNAIELALEDPSRDRPPWLQEIFDTIAPSVHAQGLPSSRLEDPHAARTRALSHAGILRRGRPSLEQVSDPLYRYVTRR